MNHAIADLRKEYASAQLLESDVAADPIEQFEKWWHQAISAQIIEANAMTLATASADGLPSARIVLLKGFDKQGFVFFTNYQSYKALQLEANPKACLVFFWKELERQIRIVGLVKKIPSSQSDQYYQSRPKESRIGAWASPQSQVIESRSWLNQQFRILEEDFGTREIQRPPHWGGYIVQPVIIEFWQGRLGRMHDRIQYTLQDNALWKIERLAP
ncbi:MAG: pyridoxamine 5'-phosphate oxidase [Flavisolibacter sp.]